MNRKFILSVLMFLSSMTIPAVAQIDGGFTGKRTLVKVEVEEFLPGTMDPIGVNTYTEENMNIPGEVANMIIREMDLQGSGSGSIVLFNGALENPDIQLTSDYFAFSAQGQPMLQGANEYMYVTDTENNELLLTPKGIVCSEKKCFRVLYFSLKRILE